MAAPAQEEREPAEGAAPRQATRDRGQAQQPLKSCSVCIPLGTVHLGQSDAPGTASPSPEMY